MTWTRFLKVLLCFSLSLFLITSTIAAIDFYGESLDGDEVPYGASDPSIGISATSLSIQQLGPYTHYNGIVFGDFQSTTADVEGALAVQGEARIGTQASYDFGGSNHYANPNGYIGSYRNSSLYPTLLLRQAPTLYGYDIKVFGGPLAISGAAQTAYEALSQKIIIREDGLSGYGLSQAEIDAITAGPVYVADLTVSQFFQNAYSETRNAAEILVNANVMGNLSVSDLHAAWYPTPYQSTLSELSGTQLAAYSTSIAEISGFNNVLVFNFTDSGSISLGSTPPNISSAFGGYDYIIFNFPNATSVSYGGQSLHIDGTQLEATYAGLGNSENMAKIDLYASKIIWNFPAARSVSINAGGVIGSVMAPDAAVTGNGGSINGMLIAGSFSTSGGMELHAFRMPNIYDPTGAGGGDDDLGKVTLTKRDAETDDPIEDAVFQLEEQDGEHWVAYGGGEAILRSIGTPTDGQGQITVTGLPPGIYRFVEVSPAPGYDGATLTLSPETFTVEKGKGSQVFAVAATNRKQPTTEPGEDLGKVTLTKRDAETKEPIEGAVFQLQQQDGNGWMDYSDPLTTDGRGEIHMGDLPVGTYRFVEISPAPGYEGASLVLSPGTFTVEKGKGSQVFAVAATNLREGILLRVIKTDKDDPDKALAGAVFQLQDTGGNSLETATTGPDGTILFETPLQAGREYHLVEISAPSGYQAGTGPILVIASSDLAVNGILTQSVTNTREEEPETPGGEEEFRLRVIKVDAQDTRKTLSGATFALLDEAGQVLETATTNREGTSYFGPLVAGTRYTLREVSAPSGYQHSDQRHTVLVSAGSLGSDSLYTVTVTNKKETGDTSRPGGGGSSDDSDKDTKPSSGGDGGGGNQPDRDPVRPEASTPEPEAPQEDGPVKAPDWIDTNPNTGLIRTSNSFFGALTLLSAAALVFRRRGEDEEK